MEYEVDFFDALATMRLHSACLQIWQTERQNGRRSISDGELGVRAEPGV
jgi:hypothetical protein